MKRIYNGSAGPEWLVKAVAPQAQGSTPCTPLLKNRFITGYLYLNHQSLIHLYGWAFGGVKSINIHYEFKLFHPNRPKYHRKQIH
jgi:hypothetical protein